MPELKNVIIIGSGPAGFTAGLYTARAKLAPLMLEGEPISNTDIPGGQLMLTSEIENYPGFEHGLPGPDLMGIMRKQAQRFGTEIITKRATRVAFGKRPFLVEWEGGSALARSVVIATGAKSKLLGLPQEETLMSKGVSTCATCDGAFFNDADLIVVGGGDSAMEEATFLTKFARRVTIVHRRDAFRASKIMLDRARNNSKIDFVLDSTVSHIHGADQVTGVTLKNLKTGKETEKKVEGVFVAIGHSPNTELFKGQIVLDENGYVVLKKGTQTSVEGVFACGDVADHVYRQAITAAGTGCQAALDCERWLAVQEHAESGAHAGARGGAQATR